MAPLLKVSVRGISERPDVARIKPVSLRLLYTGHYRDAVKRGREAMTPALYCAIVRLPCHYCGRPPTNMTKWRSVKVQFQYNGADRVNSNLGYIEGNVVACCKGCNAMKSNRTTAQFLEDVRAVAAHQATRIFPYAPT